jgi:hypothetical protein
MKLLTKAILKKLNDNYSKGDKESLPLKLFNACGAQTWLINSIEPDGDTMWGLADLGFECVEWGTMSLSEMMGCKINYPYKFMLERDLWWRGGKVQDFISKDTLSGC